MMPNTRILSSADPLKHKQDLRKTKANYDFDVFANEWQLDASRKVNFLLLNELELDSKCEMSFRLALANYACEFSSAYVVNIYSHTRLILRLDVSNQIEEQHIINFKAGLNAQTEYKLGYIRAFLLDWHDRGICGIDSKAITLLESLKISGNEKGKAVALGCPHSGAYNYDEQLAFIKWYVDAYTNNQISLLEYAFIMSLQQTGARPIQISRLYVQDIVAIENNGVTDYELNVPTAKKRHESFRASFNKKDAVNEDLILVLQAQAKQSIRYIETQYKIKLTQEQQKTVPVFINESVVVDIVSYTEFCKIQRSTPDLLWITSSIAFTIVGRLAQLCPLKTQRFTIDGEFGDLHINARRFRYTHATNLAMLGASKYVIAEELGQSDTQQVGVYTEFNEEMADRIDEALKPALIPLAQAFSGTLIDSEKDAIRVNDPRSRIGNSEGNPVGSCGQYGFCVDGTIHCYTCIKYQPWVNAPHEQVLESVLTERERKSKMGASDFVLQGYNRSIDAIKVVVAQCEKRKEELKNQGALDA